MQLARATAAGRAPAWDESGWVGGTGQQRGREKYSPYFSPRLPHAQDHSLTLVARMILSFHPETPAAEAANRLRA